jgi:pimeloyl-ACP methyl ester carboxylesterase
VLAYEEHGSGPALVFVHGIGTDRRRWAPVVELLTDDFRCVSIDLPGHGGSPDEGCDQLSACSLLHELAQRLDLRPHLIVGHSLGANTALVYGALHPPRAVVSVDPVPLYLPHFADSLAPYVERLRGGDYDAAFLEWEERFRTDDVPAQNLRGTIRPRAEIGLSYWRSLLSRDDAEALQPLFNATLAAITVPTLVCLGDPPSAQDAAILSTMGSTTVEVYEGQGHFLHLIDPERFATRLRRWIAQLPSA